MSEPSGQVAFRVPDFVDEETGVLYSDIEVIVEMDGGIGDAARLVEALSDQHPSRPR
jgi:hypothetical protein